MNYKKKKKMDFTVNIQYKQYKYFPSVFVITYEVLKTVLI